MLGKLAKLKSIDCSEGTAYSCQTLAAIGAIAGNTLGQKKLTEICKPVLNGFEIQFCKHPDVIIKVQNSELNDWTDQNRIKGQQDLKQRIEQVKEILPPEKFFWILPRFRPEHASGDIFFRVLELAYAKLMIAIDPSSYPELLPQTNPLRLYHHKNFHYDSVKVINDMTNWTVTCVTANGKSAAEPSNSFAEENKKDSRVIEKICAELSEISNNAENYVAIADSVGVPGDSYVFLDPGTLIVPCHSFIVKSVDKNNKTICLLDPYSSRIGLLLEYSDFMEYFNAIIKATVLT